MKDHCSGGDEIDEEVLNRSMKRKTGIRLNFQSLCQRWPE